MDALNFRPRRRGETERECEVCGRAYVPSARNQKRCPECAKARRHVKAV